MTGSSACLLRGAADRLTLVEGAEGTRRAKLTKSEDPTLNIGLDVTSELHTNT